MSMEMNNVQITNLVRTLAYQSPGLLICIVGMALALIFWRRCPVPSLLTLLGLGLRFVAILGNVIAIQILVGTNRSFMIGIVGIIVQLMSAIGLGLLLAAVFMGRGAKDFY
jgi:hypothetical protein